MNNLPIPPSVGSSNRYGRADRRARPAVVIEIRASWRLQVLWLAWCLALAAGLAFGLGVALWMRVALIGLLIWLGYLGLRTLQRPGVDLQRLSWGRDGRWQAQDSSGRLRYVGLAVAPQLFGPLIWLRLKSGARCQTVLIDAAGTEPLVLVTLKARLRLDQPVGEKPKS